MDHYPRHPLYSPVLRGNVFLLGILQWRRILAQPGDRHREISASRTELLPYFHLPYGRHHGAAGPGLLLFLPVQIPVPHHRLPPLRLSERADGSPYQRERIQHLPVPAARTRYAAGHSTGSTQQPLADRLHHLDPHPVFYPTSGLDHSRHLYFRRVLLLWIFHAAL